MPDRPPLPEQAASQMPKREELPERSGSFSRPGPGRLHEGLPPGHAGSGAISRKAGGGVEAFLSLSETSERLGLEPEEILEAVRNQQLPAFQEDGEWRFKPEHVALFARDGRVRTRRRRHPAAEPQPPS